FGAPQVAFAYEMQMEKIAAALGIDPVEVRRINMLREGDITATGQQLKWSVGTADVLEAAVERSRYRSIKESIAASRVADAAIDSTAQSGRKRRGIGMSLFFHGAGFTGSGEAKMKAQAGVEITSEGRVRILSGSTEIGQGTRTIFSQIVADEM